MARLTVTDYGSGSENSSDTKDLKLAIEDRVVWIVVFNDFKNFAFGPAPVDASKSSATEWEVTRLAVFVDAGTGEYLCAETVSQPG